MAKHPAAFINTLAESGSREELLKYLQQTWDDLVDLTNEHVDLVREMRELRASLEEKYHGKTGD